MFIRLSKQTEALPWAAPWSVCFSLHRARRSLAGRRESPTSVGANGKVLALQHISNLVPGTRLWNLVLGSLTVSAGPAAERSFRQEKLWRVRDDVRCGQGERGFADGTDPAQPQHQACTGVQDYRYPLAACPAGVCRTRTRVPDLIAQACTARPPPQPQGFLLRHCACTTGARLGSMASRGSINAHWSNMANSPGFAGHGRLYVVPQRVVPEERPRFVYARARGCPATPSRMQWATVDRDAVCCRPHTPDASRGRAVRTVALEPNSGLADCLPVI